MKNLAGPPRGRSALAASTTAFAALLSLLTLGSSDVRSGDRLSFALTGARVVAAPGLTFDPGVVVVRGGIVEAVGAEGKVAKSPCSGSSETTWALSASRTRPESGPSARDTIAARPRRVPAVGTAATTA